MGKRKKLSTAITMLTMWISIFTVILMGIAMVITFYFLFYDKTKEDMEYVLASTSQQVQDYIQFIEDGAVTIRHNMTLQNFFNNGPYEAEIAETQLAYSMDIFSDRNIVRQTLPFVRGVYLFNDNDQCLSEQYYPITVSMKQKKIGKYREVQRAFKASGRQYHSSKDDNSINLCYRMYNDSMMETGIIVVEINADALQLALETIDTYENSGWVVLSEMNSILSNSSSGSITGDLQNTGNLKTGTAAVSKSQMLVQADSLGFGIKIVIAAGLSNIYTLLRPTMYISLTVLIIAMAAISVITYAVCYRFTKPLKKANDSLRAFGKGEFNTRMGDSAIEEFHEIGVGFNEMADRIQYLITQVYEKQILATQSQVKFLQSQINPHFQFNILAMLSLKAKMAGNEDLYQSLIAFSKLVQGKIFREKEIKITVEKEMELVNYYLLLQNNRYKDKIKYQITYGDESVKKDLIPRLLIEPLVENAVSHGLEPKDGNGNVQINVYEEAERLYIWVIDDGVGFESNVNAGEDSLDSLWQEEIGHTHTGVENTRRLLKILYADEYTMDIDGKKGIGTTVKITLPIEK